jgi:hypothetical protein
VTGVKLYLCIVCIIKKKKLLSCILRAEVALNLFFDLCWIHIMNSEYLCNLQEYLLNYGMAGIWDLED